MAAKLPPDLVFLSYSSQSCLLPAMSFKRAHRKCLQVEELAEAEGRDNGTTRERWDVKVDHVDLGPGFWRKHPWIMTNCN